MEVGKGLLVGFILSLESHEEGRPLKRERGGGGSTTWRRQQRSRLHPSRVAHASTFGCAWTWGWWGGWGRGGELAAGCCCCRRGC